MGSAISRYLGEKSLLSTRLNKRIKPLGCLGEGIMPGEPFSLSVKPKSWKGVRDNEAPSRILDEEWVDSREVDARLGKRRKGMVQIAQPEGAVQARAVVQYLRPD